VSESKPWWQTAVFYQIYPRSFADSNDDGIGDLPGIIGKLDYIADLGIDALWISPIYPSPMADNGYDVSDYTGIGPEFGTMEDFKALLVEAHKRDIRVILDLVLNHTSNEHPWFLEASSSRDDPKRDWYIWHDGRPGNPPRPPNNWRASFGGRAWEWDPRTRQYYLHSFTSEQPDVNWRNLQLREAIYNVLRFWLDLGVDGFRLDVVNWFVHDDQFRSNPCKLGRRPYDMQRHIYDRNHPLNIEVMKEIRAVVDSYPDKMTVGEVFTEPPGDPDLVLQYYGQGKGLHSAFNFAFLYCKWDPACFAKVVEQWEAALGPDLWPVYTLSNHDNPRAASRYGKKDETLPRARVAAAMLLTLRCTPFLYYGEEIGMCDGRIPRSELRDPVGIRYWPFNPGRDPARTPMQWDDSRNAGFSSADPWLPVNADYPQVNVAAQEQDEDSLLHWYRRLLYLRRGQPALQKGAYRTIKADSNTYVFERCYNGRQIVVALNFTNRAQAIQLPVTAMWELLLGYPSPQSDNILKSNITLPPYAVLIVHRKPAQQPDKSE